MTSFAGVTLNHPRDFYIRPQYLTTRYLAQLPKFPTALHLHGLLSERLDLKKEAIESLEKALHDLEAEYEDTESAIVERQYVITNISLGRVRLSLADYEGSRTALDTALSLLQPQTEYEDIIIAELRVQCLQSKALACYFVNDVENSLQCFDDARNTTIMSGSTSSRLSRLKDHGILLLAGVLYALGGEEQRAEAERQLLEK